MMHVTSEATEALKRAASRAAENAYCPYSNFPVGAAALCDNGDIYVGCNVENASYGLTNCAERSALFAAVSDGRGRGDFDALLIYTPGNACHPPCGACRQVMAEFLAPDTPVYAVCDGEAVRVWSMEELLPDTFEYPTREPGE
ncbi:cytidine deaminase [Pseudodesulfovibrio tunisiensis]|uniref:cytidine deaminase n=1 Tax=Pseudodesulfovibrio tunisiensis TaxID=463192 RepID=UPI001FB29C0A|nr:cytidine deaminase [Pseudodesulfovibrio tunisiensis]